MKLIPLHSVVFLIGSPERAETAFPEHEVLNSLAIQRDLTGYNVRSAIGVITAQEIHRRMLSKLKLGERVIIHNNTQDGVMTRQQRTALASAARSQGVPVFYLICEHSDKEAMRGDGIAEVIDFTDPMEELTVIEPPYDFSKYNGITVIGDIHGMYQSLLTALQWARQRNHFIILLGDLIDYGPGTLEVVDEVYRLVMRGEAICILGNHERKIMRWLDGERVRLSEGNKTTTNALNQIGETQRLKWAGRFRGLYQNSHLIYCLNNCIFVHGALHPDYLKDGEVTKVVENHAFFGEVDESRSQPERPVRSYRWIDSIPGERIVVVGHDRRAAKPLVETNANGGTAIFLDTGSGKGGVLSSADFRLNGDSFKMTNFNIF